MHEAAGLGGAHVFDAGAVGEVEHHQRLEATAVRAGGEDALAIGGSFIGVAYWRHQVGHDDRAGELARGVGHGVR
ncbi:hypothetical protein D3C77_640820 [compost metagenome]